jgi:hypothetical protein
LLPFLDSNGILRAQGRIQNSNIEDICKTPIILPSKHPLTTLLIRNIHNQHHHIGPQSLLYTVRQEYWSINGKQIVKKIIRECLICFRNKPRNQHPLMGNLPSYRVTPSSPFTHTGLDYCGPFSTKTKFQRKGPIYKSYVAIFVCMATKALHLEVVSDLSTECFLFALKRFIFRRGKPAKIYCDNQTTFVGAKNQLNEVKEFIKKNNDSIMSYATTQQIEFTFIPAHSPSMGGIWESGVKSFKHHLKRITKDQVFTFEQLSTLAVEIEGCLNSRQLTIISNDASGPLPLSPGNFLIGRPTTAINERLLLNENINLLTRWQRVQHCVQSFWSRWSKEYLNSLQMNQPSTKSQGWRYSVSSS